jgi:hypothetical protein
MPRAAGKETRRANRDEADGNKVVGEGTSRFIFGPDGKFKGLLLDKGYAQKKRWAKVTRVKSGEDRFENQFLIEQLALLGSPGSADCHHQLFLKSISKILSQKTFSPETLLARYCVFVPILDSIREILTAPSAEASEKLLERFKTRIQSARKLLSLRGTDEEDFGPQERFTKTVFALAKKFDREPTLAEVGKILFPEELDHKRRIRVSQLASQTGFKLPHGKPGPIR